jgi:Ferritin-like domain/TAT (twin-arginine translocation) pathway signal sequence
MKLSMSRTFFLCEKKLLFCQINLQGGGSTTIKIYQHPFSNQVCIYLSSPQAYTCSVVGKQKEHQEEMMNTNPTNAVVNRRQLLKVLGITGAGAALAACDPVVPPPEPDTDYDAAILTFALNLEYLEAAFYLAAVGRIDELPGGDADVLLPAGFDGKTSIAFTTPAIAQYAQEIANDELAHVVFLRKAIGGILKAPVADRPVIDLAGAFAAAANAAFKTTTPLSPVFDPFANELFFLHGAFIFEDVGVTAYKGAAPVVTDLKTVLASAAGILAVEAYHSGEIRTLLYAQKDVMTPYKVPVSAVVQAISDLRGAAGNKKDQGIVINGKANIVPTDENGIAFSRTPREVANIVFLDTTGKALKGGFFPEGLNVPAALADDFGILLSL